jgi:hypothetical protein
MGAFRRGYSLAADFGVPIASPPHGAGWPSLVTLWQLAGQTLLVRLQALEQLSAWSGTPGPDMAAYDAAVEEYIGQIRTTWNEIQQRWTAAAPAAAGPADFVERLVTDPTAPPATVMFAGFAGRASSDDDVRFYLDAELSSFVDIRREDVLHTQAVPTAQAPLGGQYVWARRDPELVRTLEEAAGRAAAVPADPAAQSWSGPPWTATGNGDPAPVSAFADLSPSAPAADAPAAAGFPDDEEEIPLPPGWPQAVT